MYVDKSRWGLTQVKWKFTHPSDYVEIATGCSVRVQVARNTAREVREISVLLVVIPQEVEA